MSEHQYISKTNEAEQISFATRSATSSVNTATNAMNPRTLQKANDTLEIAEELVAEAQTHAEGALKILTNFEEGELKKAHHQLRTAELSEENHK